MNVYELNMDGLVGPTHNYAGLAVGNLASISHAHQSSNPQEAAKQGLAKMRLLFDMGLKQAILPPHQRPNLALLHHLGFQGSPARQIEKAYREAPELLSACYSASSMWAANAATIAASSDTADGRVHFTAANLMSHLHRHEEAAFSHYALQRIFANPSCFHHHCPLPASIAIGDEGAANHSRLCKTHGHPGVHLFVYGLQQGAKAAPLKYPARQTLEASSAIARLHQLAQKQVLFAQQNPEAIDCGVFHNDVICVANESLLLVHEKAFVGQASVLESLKSRCDFPLSLIEISENQLTLADAVTTYLFNSQLLTKPDGSMVLIAPSECERHMGAKALIESLIASVDNPLHTVHYMDLKQSMYNGGGPACLRLRIPLTENELRAMHQGVLLTPQLFDALDHWISRHYRTELRWSDLRDPALVTETLTALDELTNILQLGSFYPFQQENSAT